ncbi:MAG: polysaccharide biosynthesis protein [Rhodobacteraceae bacterium]|nr:polysaccharide biosynthesis protein [Paracoccaceae bacterium]MBR9821197.1 polysaccharide biosynthesis protein [Paracoccaceae bacterium]
MMLRFLALWLTGFGPRRKAVTLLALDGMAATLAVVVTVLALPGTPGGMLLAPMWGTCMALGALLGLHRMKLRAYQQQGLPRSLAQGAALALLLFLAPAWPLSAAQVLLLTALFTLASMAGRLAMLRLAIQAHALARRPQRLLIWGGGRAAQQLAAALAGDESRRVLGVLDHESFRQGGRVAGLPVHAPARAAALVARLRIDRIVLALPPTAQLRARQALAGTACEVQSLQDFAAELWGNAGAAADLSRLLGRKGLEQVLPEMRDSYRDQVVLVTGAGGSIGGELSRQLARLGPRRLILLDHSELALYEISRDLSEAAPEVIPVLGSVCDAALMARLLARQAVQVIFHAAAYKHVPLVERTPLEGIRNNVMGTRTLAEAAARAGVDRMILVSTDKAVRPRSVMGASKRLAEMIMQEMAARGTPTRFSMVRFGNVMGSSGSVVPLFAEQIARGGPVTVTHPQVTRYFMTGAEAVRLTLLSGHYATGGEVFVLDMGPPQPILQLARQMIRDAGLTPREAETPQGDIEIRFTGLRPGEKLEEELLIGARLLPTPHPRILRVQEALAPASAVHSALDALDEVLARGDEAAAGKVLMHWAGKQWPDAADPDACTLATRPSVPVPPRLAQSAGPPI